MGRGINKVILIGNLGKTPESGIASSGSVFATLSVATTDVWRDRASDQVQERTEWHRVVLYGRVAEIARDYLKKGSKVFVEGSLRTRKWQDQTGQDRYTTEIHGRNLEMLDRAKVDEPASASPPTAFPQPVTSDIDDIPF